MTDNAHHRTAGGTPPTRQSSTSLTKPKPATTPPPCTAEATAGLSDPPPPEVIPVRLDPDLERALKARAQADHANTSEVIRDALRAWLRTA